MHKELGKIDFELSFSESLLYVDYGLLRKKIYILNIDTGEELLLQHVYTYLKQSKEKSDLDSEHQILKSYSFINLPSSLIFEINNSFINYNLKASNEISDKILIYPKSLENNIIDNRTKAAFLYMLYVCTKESWFIYSNKSIAKKNFEPQKYPLDKIIELEEQFDALKKVIDLVKEKTLNEETRSDTCPEYNPTNTIRSISVAFNKDKPISIQNRSDYLYGHVFDVILDYFITDLESKNQDIYEYIRRSMGVDIYYHKYSFDNIKKFTKACSLFLKTEFDLTQAEISKFIFEILQQALLYKKNRNLVSTENSLTLETVRGWIKNNNK